jgi:hypothetical protein
VPLFNGNPIGKFAVKLMDAVHTGPVYGWLCEATRLYSRANEPAHERGRADLKPCFIQRLTTKRTQQVEGPHFIG